MRRRILWIGGSSGLARTYCNHYGWLEQKKNEELILMGVEPLPPNWLDQFSYAYISCDLTKIAAGGLSHSLRRTLQGQNITSVIVGVRPPLVYYRSNAFMRDYNQRLLQGLEILTKFMLSTGTVRQVIHISSVAAVDHMKQQVMVREEDHHTPPLSTNAAPYDQFKNQSEILINKLLSSGGVAVSYAHLRISAIFSDSESCIQCNALELQSYFGPRIPIRIDCNSSRNVSTAIRLMLDKMDRSMMGTPLPTLYYYTRPTAYTQPIPYGDYLLAYRRQQPLPFWALLWIPYFLVQYLTRFIHWFATSRVAKYVPFSESMDYLLQVSSREHTFDNSRFQREFPRLSALEESTEECFQRRRILPRNSRLSG